MVNKVGEMRKNISWSWIVGLLVLLYGVIGIGLKPWASAADWYISAQAGLTLPQDLGNIERADSGTGVSVSDLELQTSIVYGGKLGVFFPGKFNWLGIEGEVFNVTPHLKQQAVTTTTTSGSPVSGSIAGAHLRVTTAAINAMVRYPGKRFQPYAGAGLGAYWFRLSDSTGFSDTETNVGFNGLAGVRYFFMEAFSFLTEYKSNYALMKFTDTLPGTGTIRLQGDYTAHHFVGGITFHFDGPS